MPEECEQLSNSLTVIICRVIAVEVLGAKAQGELYGHPRIFAGGREALRTPLI